jgi:UDP-glucuronate decarboxylase
MVERTGEYCMVTGATGVIGRPVVHRLLECGRKVLAVGQKPSPFPAHDNLTYASLDLHDTDAVHLFVDRYKPQQLIHLAWEATPGKFWHSRENFKWVSTSAFLLDSFISAGGQKAVLAGSCAEYDWTNSLLNEETSDLSPKTLYSVSKDAFRRMAEVIGKDIDLVWGRIFFPYGQGEDPSKLTSYIAQEIFQGRTPSIHTPNRAGDFIHLRDIARVFEALAYKEITGAVNVCSGEAVLPHKIAFEIAKLDGNEAMAASFRKQLEANTQSTSVVGTTDFDLGSLLSLEDGLKSYLQ